MAQWMVPRELRARFEPHARAPEANFSFYEHRGGGGGVGDVYDMHAVPPPVYNPNFAQPPAYPGLSSPKANPFADPLHVQRANGEGSNSSTAGIAMPPPSVPPPNYS
jgi:hypothetical protein